MTGTRARGLTLTELLALLVALALLLGFALPSLEGVSCDGGRARSADNLRTLHGAHVMYGGDWNDRQFTLVRDDLGRFGGDCATYNARAGCHPPILFGEDCDGVLRGLFFCDHPRASCDSFDLVKPTNFAGPFQHRGSFRIPNARGFHEYVNGRLFDPVFYPPQDSPIIEQVQPFFPGACEFVAEGAELAFSSSYVLSPAAMFHPDVFAADDWTSPDSVRCEV